MRRGETCAGVSTDSFATTSAGTSKRGAPAAYSPVIGAYAGLLNDLGEFPAAQKAAEEALAIDDALGDRLVE